MFIRYDTKFEGNCSMRCRTITITTLVFNMAAVRHFENVEFFRIWLDYMLFDVRICDSVAHFIKVGCCFSYIAISPCIQNGQIMVLNFWKWTFCYYSVLLFTLIPRDMVRNLKQSRQHTARCGQKNLFSICWPSAIVNFLKFCIFDHSSFFKVTVLNRCTNFGENRFIFHWNMAI